MRESDVRMDVQMRVGVSTRSFCLPPPQPPEQPVCGIFMLFVKISVFSKFLLFNPRLYRFFFFHLFFLV